MSKWKGIILGLSISLSLSGCIESNEEKFDRAMGLYVEEAPDQASIIEARKILEELSTKGHAKAQYMLARMYIRGDGVAIDFNKALELLLKSSATGNGDASIYSARFYYEDKFGQPKDLPKARQLIYKSARDGSDIGRLILSGYHLTGGLGIERNIDEAVKELKLITDDEYKKYASLALYSIYSEPNSKFYSPSDAVAELEKVADFAGPIFRGRLAAAYLGHVSGSRIDGLNNPSKHKEYMDKLYSNNDKQAVAVAKITSGESAGTENIQLMIDAIKVDDVDGNFAELFCQTMSGAYVGEKREKSFDLNDIIKACTFGANENNSYHQYVLAAANLRHGRYDEAYKWALVSGMNNNGSGFLLAGQIKENYLDAREAVIRENAEKLFISLKENPKSHPILPPHDMPWYKPSAM